MTLIQGQEKFAIQHKYERGPIFGGGNNDLQIGDKCNQDDNNYGSFPTSYNCGSKYQNNQESWTLFSGATNGCKFKVSEYEVFEVVK